MRTLFDRYVTVDWSANNAPKRGRDSIWICNLDGQKECTSNPPTRGSAHDTVRDLLMQSVRRHERVLVGFDFPYGYPRGFARALGLRKGRAWRAIWNYVNNAIEDDAETNRSNRFAVAGEINRHLGAHSFWGRPANPALNHLSPLRDRVSYRVRGSEVGLYEWREVEYQLRQAGRHPHSTWKLHGVGAVGSQALTGLPVVASLRFDVALKAVSRVWPFELDVPNTTEGKCTIIHAEIWPSLLASSAKGQVKDQAQVIHLAHHLRNLDRSGDLPRLFVAASSSAAAKEEGWILGVLPDGRVVETALSA